MAAKIKTVNVVEHNSLECHVHSYPDTREGYREAEKFFRETILSNNSKTSESDIDNSVKVGYYHFGGDGCWSVSLVHSK